MDGSLHRVMRLTAAIVACAAAAALAPGSSQGADWPTYLCNSSRNASTDHKVSPPLVEVWVHHPRHAPQPAWPPPARDDFFHEQKNIDPRMIFDRAYQVAVAGDSLFYGSSADHKVYCLDTATGRLKWSFFTEGPVRLAPTVWEGRVYAGSDDGWVYCLDAGDGALVWKYRPAQEDRRLPGNGHVISLWPVRSGVLVEKGTAHVCAGLFPLENAYLCALDARTGKEIRKTAIERSAQGYMVDAGTRLFIPTGRTGPVAVDSATGKPVRLKLGKDVRGEYMVAMGDRLLLRLGRYHRALAFEGISRIHAAEHAVSRDGTVYFVGRNEMSALKMTSIEDEATYLNELKKTASGIGKLRSSLKRLAREKKEKEHAQVTTEIELLEKKSAELAEKLKSCFVWKSAVPGDDGENVKEPSYSLICAGDVLFSGRDGAVRAFGAGDGAEIWTGEVAGRAYGLAAAGGRLFVSTDKGTIHCFAPAGSTAAGQAESTRDTPPPPRDVPAADLRKAVDRITEALPTTRGYCLVLGCGDGRLVRELAARTEFTIVGREQDAQKVAAAREALDTRVLYGRVAIHHGPPDALPYPEYFANLVVIEDPSGVSPSEVGRVLRPFGGVALRADGGSMQQWMKGALPAGGEFADSGAVMRRGPLPQAGEWTHQYANPANTACSNDELAHGPMRPLWFGKPGPRAMIDRHANGPAPLFKAGRVFIPANEKVVAIDAYNGTGLWSLAAPGSGRFAIMRDSGHMAVAEDRLYMVAGAECWSIDVATGRRERTLSMPQVIPDRTSAWGYLAVTGDLVFGTGQAPEASFGDGNRDLCFTRGANRPTVAADYLFALDRERGRKKWHRRQGTILNSGITIGDGRVYFVESEGVDPAAGREKGRVLVERFLGGTARLVALDTGTGAVAWERPVQLPFQHVFYLCFANRTVLTVGSFIREKKSYYGIRVYHAETGEPGWKRDFPSKKPGVHGEESQHPVIIGDRIFSKFYACDLLTGEPVPKWKVVQGTGCGTLSASAGAFFWRGSNPQMYDLAASRTIPLNKATRPGCLINIIPAGGIISIPEASSGCTCAYPIQTSIAYVPAP